MSAPRRALARPTGGALRLRVMALAAFIPLAATILVHAASAADPPPAARRLDAAEARRAGVAMELVTHADLPGQVLEVEPIAGAAAPAELLAVAPGSEAAAVTNASGPGATMLVVANADGSQLQLDVEGVLGATFAPDGSWLAVIDGAGRLWRLDAGDGTVSEVADGPFVGSPLIDVGGRILALAVPSVEAPYQSFLVRVDPASGEPLRISAEELVYGATWLADGALAVVAHHPGETVILRQANDESTLHANLGPDAVNVSVSGDARLIAWESVGQVYVRGTGGRTRALGAGSSPQLAADGTSILVERGGESILLDIEGRALARLSAASALVGCAGGCRS